MHSASLFATAARVIAPRKPLTVSQWADTHRILSSKASAMPGRWVTDRNPLLRERRVLGAGPATFTLVVSGRPARAGIDPDNKLIDRKPGDNMVEVE